MLLPRLLTSGIVLCLAATVLAQPAFPRRIKTLIRNLSMPSLGLFDKKIYDECLEKPLHPFLIDEFKRQLVPKSPMLLPSDMPVKEIKPSRKEMSPTDPLSYLVVGGRVQLAVKLLDQLVQTPAIQQNSQAWEAVWLEMHYENLLTTAVYIKDQQAVAYLVSSHAFAPTFLLGRYLMTVRRGHVELAQILSAELESKPLEPTFTRIYELNAQAFQQSKSALGLVLGASAADLQRLRLPTRYRYFGLENEQGVPLQVSSNSPQASFRRHYSV
ncbi:hypothetical protein IWQ60_003472 [Tieghemiomyces parasiticus]|uniref:Uncharacterized protein n=1 Tax=Tieghemiomyces parasiticus TaxID=78921 RepID=A0A9W8ACT6_9FUNG|nr:hypothetical protein IWQ60_003472 [Tieghemiomyces parasiticus]